MDSDDKENEEDLKDMISEPFDKFLNDPISKLIEQSDCDYTDPPSQDFDPDDDIGP